MDVVDGTVCVGAGMIAGGVEVEVEEVERGVRVGSCRRGDGVPSWTGHGVGLAERGCVLISSVWDLMRGMDTYTNR